MHLNQITDTKIVKSEIEWQVKNFPLIVNLQTSENSFQAIQSEKVEVRDPETDELICRWNLILQNRSMSGGFYNNGVIHIQVDGFKTINGTVWLQVKDREKQDMMLMGRERKQVLIEEIYTFGDELKTLEYYFGQSTANNKTKDLRIYCSIKFSFPIHICNPEPTGLFGFVKSILTGSIFMPLVEGRRLYQSEFSESKRENKETQNTLDINNPLELLFDNEKFSDVILKVGNREIKAHKTILMAQSDVFAAMFSHDMKENQENVVVFTDISFKLLKEIVYFLYTNKSPNLRKCVFDMIDYTEKYNLTKLKAMCLEELQKQITVKTVAKVYILADLYRDPKLKQLSLEFIKRHMSEVVIGDGWKNLIENHKDIAAEISRAINKSINLSKIDNNNGDNGRRAPRGPAPGRNNNNNGYHHGGVAPAMF